MGPGRSVDPQGVAHRRRHDQARDARKRRRRSRPHQPEAPKGMPLDPLLPNADPQPGVLRHLDRRCGKHRQATRLPLVGKMPVDRPALPSPEHARRRPAGLLVVGLGTAKRYRERRRVPRRIDLHLHPAHDDIAVVVTAEAAATGEGRIGKQFEADAPKRTGGKEGFDLVGVERRLGPLDEPRAILEPAKRCSARALQGERFECLPDLVRQVEHRADRTLPVGNERSKILLTGTDRLVGVEYRLLQADDLGGLFGRRQRIERIGVAAAARLASHDRAGFGNVTKQREEGVELALRERVELVVMAAGTADREAEPGLAGRLDAIDDRLHPPLLGDDPPFAVDPVVAVETGGDDRVARRRLVARCRRKHVTGELVDRELIEGKVAVVGRDHPVAPRPIRAARIGLVAVAVGIAGRIEPFDRHPLAEVRARELQIDILLIRHGGRIGDESGNLLRRRWQAREVETHPPGEHLPRSFAVGAHPFGRETRENEVVDRRLRPLRVARLRHLRPRDSLEGPVAPVGGAGCNPAAQQLCLGRRHRLADMRRRHNEIGIGRLDPGEQLAGRPIAGHDSPVATVEHETGTSGLIEPQSPLSLRGVGAMAGKAAVGEERTDVAVEVDRRNCRSRGSQLRCDDRRPHADEEPRAPRQDHGPHPQADRWGRDGPGPLAGVEGVHSDALSSPSYETFGVAFASGAAPCFFLSLCFAPFLSLFRSPFFPFLSSLCFAPFSSCFRSRFSPSARPAP